MVTLPPMPDAIAALPRDERGYPIPWFTAYVDDGTGSGVLTPDLRLSDARKFAKAVSRDLCWVCGGKLGKPFTFVVGSISAITNCSGEPPSHRECAEFSVRACPFLSRPKAKRRDAGLPEDAYADPSRVDRNPGVMALWTCRSFMVDHGAAGGFVIIMPNPAEIVWYCEGRRATRDEVAESIRGGLKYVREAAAAGGPEAIAESELAIKRAERLLPHD